MVDDSSNRREGRELIERAKEGDRRAMAQLYQEHHERIFRQTFVLVRDPDLADDLTQEAFARAFAGLDAFDPGRAAFTTWMYGIAVNLVREHWRRRSRRLRLVDRLRSLVPRPSSPDPEDRLHSAEEIEALYEALQRLPAALREAVVMTDLQQLAPAEAAARLGISPGNVRVRAHRGRRRLRGLLKEGGA